MNRHEKEHLRDSWPLTHRTGRGSDWDPYYDYECPGCPDDRVVRITKHYPALGAPPVDVRNVVCKCVNTDNGQANDDCDECGGYGYRPCPECGGTL